MIGYRNLQTAYLSLDENGWMAIGWMASNISMDAKVDTHEIAHADKQTHRDQSGCDDSETTYPPATQEKDGRGVVGPRQ